MQNEKKIGLVLGSGSARGWGHIGVLNALNEAGIFPDIVCGSSVGSIVAAAYANNRLQHLQEGILKLDRWDLVRFFELNFTGGVVDSSRLKSFLGQYVVEPTRVIEELDIPFACNATDLSLGREVSFTSGSALEAIWCSIALPGLFQPVKHGTRWLVDGGLVNPVPISLARQLGADIVVAVNLNGDLMSTSTTAKENIAESPLPQPSHTIAPPAPLNRVKGDSIVEGQPIPAKDNNTFNNVFNNALDSGSLNTAFESIWDSLSQTLKKSTSYLFVSKEESPPNLFDTMAGTINIMQDLITRSKMAGDPPDIVLTPRLGQLGLLEFDRADEAIEEGRHCVERVLPEIKYLLNR